MSLKDNAILLYQSNKWLYNCSMVSIGNEITHKKVWDI